MAWADATAGTGHGDTPCFRSIVESEGSALDGRDIRVPGSKRVRMVDEGSRAALRTSQRSRGAG
jgi:hypothetical protein